MKTSRVDAASPAFDGRSSKTVVAGLGGGASFLGISFMAPLSYIGSSCVSGRHLAPRGAFRREEATVSTTGNTGGDSGPRALGEGIRALRAQWGWVVAFGVVSLIAGA